MQVTVKDLSANMELKNKGMELQIKDNDGNHLGDLVINKAALIWCKGRTRQENGKRIAWKKFIDMVESV